MTNRERIWRRARSWVAGWNGGKSTPTLEMAYLAGWQAALREQRKNQRAEIDHARQLSSS